MEVRIYDRNLDLKGIIENQTSHIWTPKFFEPGTFELHIPITDYSVSILKRGNLITMRGREDAGIIEDLDLKKTAVDNEITAKGRFLAAYMDRRIIRGTKSINSSPEKAMYDLLKDATPIPLLEIGDPKGFEGSIEGQVCWENLLDFMIKLAKAGNVGFRFRPDFNAKKIIFETYQGTDHSLEQSQNNRVIFSDMYDNIETAEYRIVDQDYRNVAYVVGADENGSEVVRTVGDTAATGLDRYEIYVNGKSVSAREAGSTSAFYAALDQEGKNTLEAHPLSETFEGDVNANGNFIYRANYDIGDICTVQRTPWDISLSSRITEIEETYEYESVTVTPTFGDPLPTAIDWSKYNR